MCVSIGRGSLASQGRWTIQGQCVCVCVLTRWYVRFSRYYRGAVEVMPVLLMAWRIFIYLSVWLVCTEIPNSSTVVPFKRTTKQVQGVHIVKLNSDHSQVKQARRFPLWRQMCPNHFKVLHCTLSTHTVYTLQLTRKDFSLKLWWDDRQLPKQNATLFYLRSLSSSIQMCCVWLWVVLHICVDCIWKARYRAEHFHVWRLHAVK